MWGAFECPYCKRSYPESYVKKYSIPQAERDAVFDANEKVELVARRCPYCDHLTLDARKDTGEYDHFEVRVQPGAMPPDIPEYVPAEIGEDYREAFLIQKLSPKASATLCRRCLQGMIRDFWGIQRNTLYQEIQALEQVVPRMQWKAIDALRKMGNVGAHMEKNVNEIAGVEPNEAEMMVRMIGNLIQNWYVARHEQDELYNSIVKQSEDMTSPRKRG